MSRLSRLAQIVEKIRDTEAAFATLQRSVAADPNSFSLALSLKSIEKRKGELEAEFFQVTKEEYLDVCSYRLFSGEEARLKIASLGYALVNFQGLFTVLFDALKNGPKQIARVDAAIASLTAFDFGYSYSGSVGLVFTLPNERLLMGETELDATMRTLFEMAQSKDSASIAAFAKRLGPAPVRKLYRWVDDLILAGVGADVKWQRQREIKAHLVLDTMRLARLKEVIAATSDETSQTIELSGILLGLDVDTRRFHLKTDTGEEIRGELSPKIGTKLSVDFGTKYNATVLVRRIIHFATDTEDATYLILDLAPVGQAGSQS